MKLDAFSQKKRFVQVGENRLAYFEEGSGAPLLLLHGCPFSSFVWRKVIPLLSGGFRCLAPDLLGLGDTETPDNGDWSLRSQTNAVLGFLDSLHIGKCHVLGHDHGGAVAQLLASEHAERIDRLILANAEHMTIGLRVKNARSRDLHRSPFWVTWRYGCGLERLACAGLLRKRAQFTSHKF